MSSGGELASKDDEQVYDDEAEEYEDGGRVRMWVKMMMMTTRMMDPSCSERDMQPTEHPANFALMHYCFWAIRLAQETHTK